MNSHVLYPECLCYLIFRLATKVTIAGGALYVACDSGLLGNGEQGSEALGKAKAAIPPAIEEWMKYFGLEVQIICLSIILIGVSRDANATQGRQISHTHMISYADFSLH